MSSTSASTLSAVQQALVLLVLFVPAGLTAVLALAAASQRPKGEAWVGGITRLAMFVGFAAAAGAGVIYATSGAGPSTLSFGSWFSTGGHGFSLTFLVDGPALAFATLTFAIGGVVAAFSFRYLHREPGYRRYFVLFAAFMTGMTGVAMAGSIDVLFAGWELLGLSSALLVGFFHERPAPAHNALRVFTVYRVGDAAMLATAVLLHHWAGTGSLTLLFSEHKAADVTLAPAQATVLAILLITAVGAKSALLPFSGWLPRAMEGPTPSSAVYYGALSIHAGCFLLLRATPLLQQSLAAQLLAAAAGLSTAVYASLTGRVQTDIKSALAYASLTQVGLIVVEVAAGLPRLAFVHMAGHACYRLLQLLSASNLLYDLHELELKSDAAAHRPAPPGAPARAPSRRDPVYLFLLERGFVDALVARLVVGPILALLRWADRIDRLTCGGAGRRDHARAALPSRPGDGR